MTSWAAHWWCGIALLAMLSGCTVLHAPVPERMTMEALHQNGGVPPGWRFTSPAGDPVAGRRVFVELGCHSCHTVQGESSPTKPDEPLNVGPDLSGMGSHHPAEYFTESILNPDAVLVDGPGYLTASGHSVMPSYPDMTVRQLGDIVAYLKSLTSGGHPPTHVYTRVAGAAPAPAAWGYLAQAYEIDDAQIEVFYHWFDRAELRKYEGLVSIDTYASRLRDGRHLILCLFGFESDLALSRFAEQRAHAGDHPDDFVRPVRQYMLETPALYRAVQMSWP